jgi:tetratricopeptide (TPR) repeat protein
LLCAALQPVTLHRLSRCGIPRDRLPFALIDLKDFLRVHRVRLWHDSLAEPDAEPENRYEIAHEAFLRFVRDDAELGPRLRAAHARIGMTARPDRWTDLDPTDNAQLYDLRNVLVHLDAAGMDEAAALVRGDEAYARSCWSAAIAAQEKARHRTAVDLYDQAEDVFRHLVEVEGRTERANDLAMALVNKVNALARLGRLEEALAAYDPAIAICQRLVEREGRTKLANDLAMALVCNALALEKQDRWLEALACYEEAIRWNEACVEAGMDHFRGALLQVVRYRMMTLLDLGHWDEAAADVVRFLNHAGPALQSGSPPEAVRRELRAMVERLRELPDDAWSQVEAGLGPWAETVSAMVHGSG